MELVSIKSDLAFRAVFGREEAQCKIALMSLLEAILDVEIKSLDYANPLNFREYQDDKESEMDLEIILNTGERIDIEIQRRNVEAFKKRMIYYGSKLLIETISSGEDWSALKKVKVISILEFTLFPQNQRFKNSFCYRNREDSIDPMELDDITEIIFLELTKLPRKTAEDMCELERWLYFLEYVGEENLKAEQKSILEQIIKESEGVKMAYNLLGQVSADDMLRTKIRMQEKAQRDYYGRINYALNEGIEKGRQEGLEEGMAKGLEKGMEKGLEQGIEKGIKELISMLVDLEIDEAIILKRLQKSYDLSPEKARAFYEKHCMKC